MSVARLSAKIDRRSLSGRLWIDDDIRSTRLVGNEHFVSAGRVRNAVWKPDPAYTRRDLQRPVIDDSHFVVPGRRDVDLMMRWHDPDTRSTRHVCYFSDNLSIVGVEDDGASGVHVVHVDAAARRVHTLVVESVRRSGQRDLAHKSESRLWWHRGDQHGRAPAGRCERRRACRAGTLTLGWSSYDDQTRDEEPNEAH